MKLKKDREEGFIEMRKGLVLVDIMRRGPAGPEGGEMGIYQIKNVEIRRNNDGPPTVVLFLKESKPLQQILRRLCTTTTRTIK